MKGSWAAGAAMVAMVAMLAAAPAAPAQDGKPAPDPEALIEQGVQNFLSAIELMLMAIPRYAAPEVLPNGDILIRRLPPPGEEGEAPPETEGGAGEREI